MSTTIGDPGLTGIPAVSTPATPDDSNVPNRLISASKVEGTAVYNRAGERLGTVEDIMLDKVSGKVAFAVMSFGGFLGIGEKYHPLPWSTLTYDIAQGGYVVDMTREQLQDAPSYGAEDGIDFNDDAYGRRVYDYYKAPYWNVGF
ncbi:PRC-barrel domain-containing protein [Roseomonas gilardii subsp. gilardii]|uniref:PRC-barrel domain-containing protein n=1 Tax=Roseomonas gilardii TaxID=257708 RepID=UPI001FFB040F|nr:PRC-barrel domain-containing protein [Roseomonas gilardii]UPG73099.1 PRC-barrel domain-containing protein [Roseomonas gilardii subsp. gilardii]